MSDLATVLATGIRSAAEPGGVCYTERQLYYEVCRTLRPTPGLTPEQARWALAATMLPALVALRRPRRAAALAAAGVLVAGALHGLRRLPFTLAPPIAYDRFAGALRAYCARYGTPSGLLPSVSPAPPSLGEREPDLADYGLPRLLVCQRAEVAQMLFANRFHMELSCAVLAIAEAMPLPDMIRAMLERTRGARAYLLHDASAQGLGLVPGLRARLKLPAGIRISAIGLRPAHALQLHLFAQRMPSEAVCPHNWPSYLSARERTWLKAGWCAEVEAIRPARLLCALRRSMLASAPVNRRMPSLRRDRDVGFMTRPVG